MRRPTKKKAFLNRSANQYGTVFWSIRSSKKPRQRTLVWLGRCPDDPHERERFFLKVRLAMARYGLVEAIKRGIKPIKPLPEQTVRNLRAMPAEDDQWWNRGGHYTGNPTDVEDDEDPIY